LSCQKPVAKINGPHIVPLSEPALARLQGLYSDGGKYVFGPFNGWCHGKKRLDNEIAKRRGAPLGERGRPHESLVPLIS
jgi:hypothetical protein